MCGICGVVGRHGAVVGPGDVRPMLEALRQRGPDDEGIWSDGVAVLGHRRLSIIDLAGGHQPLGNEDGQVQVVLNGEIYDFPVLRAELQSRGHVFRTASDTEVLVHGWETWGERLVDRLNGMFAFAIWDARRRSLFLARDRFGKKPLFWTAAGGRFSFASTLSALLRLPRVPRTVDPLSLARYLTFGFVPAPESMLAGVQKLPPGHTLMLAEGREPKIERYFRPWSGTSSPRPSRQAAAEEVRRLLLAATKRRLVADVPVGILLSGGLDSSSVVAAAAHAGAGRIRTFTIGFEEASFDESEFARLVAHHYGTDHVEERIGPQDLLGVVPDLGSILDEPVADSSIVPTLLVSRLARRFVGVALGGDGGDELFAGYPTHWLHFMLSPMESLAASPLAWKALDRLAHLLPVSYANLSVDFKLGKTAQGLRFGKDVRNQVWFGIFPPDAVASILGQPISPEEILQPAAREYREARGRHVERVLVQDAVFFLGHRVLTKVDRASMSCALEVRAPMLDLELAQFVMSLPLRFKLGPSNGKSILREAVRPWLPRRVLTRPKQGFGMPIGAWVRGPLRDWSRSLLLDEGGLCGAGFVQREACTRLFEEHAAGRANHQQQIWALLLLELWRRHHGVRAAFGSDDQPAQRGRREGPPLVVPPVDGPVPPLRQIG
jgi:asparagine synthase (glutamine-hydrolysing)